MITDVARLKEVIKNYEANLDGWSPEISTIIKIIDHENKKPVISEEAEGYILCNVADEDDLKHRASTIFTLVARYFRMMNDNTTLHKKFAEELNDDKDRLAIIQAILSGEWEVEQEEKYKIGDYAVREGAIFHIIGNVQGTSRLIVTKLYLDNKKLIKKSITPSSIERIATQEEINLFKAAEMYADHGRSYGDLRKGDIVKNLRMPDSYAEILTSEKYIDLVQEDIDKGYVKLLMTKEEFEKACEK